MDDKQTIKNKDLTKTIELLSEEDLESIASGKGLSPKAKEVLTWVGVGLGGAATTAIIGLGIAAYAGKKNHGNVFHYFGNTEMDRN